MQRFARVALHTLLGVRATDLTPGEERHLAAARPNLLTAVAALGFGDIPCKAFVTAYDAVADGGWIAFNIKADFLEAADRSGFAELVTAMLADGCSRSAPACATSTGSRSAAMRSSTWRSSASSAATRRARDAEARAMVIA